MLLSDLPPELLSLICKLVDPEDFASFSAVNRQFSLIAARLREKHFEQWRKFAHFGGSQGSHFGDPQAYGLSYRFWHHLLYSVLEGWEGAKYVRCIDYDYLQDIWSWANRAYQEWDFQAHEQVVKHRDRPPSTDWPDGEQEAVLQSHDEVLGRALKDEIWFANVKGPDPLVMLVLLLTRLTNLRTLRLSSMSARSLPYLGSAAYHAALSQSLSRSHNSAFGRLTRVDFLGGAFEDNELAEFVFRRERKFNLQFLSSFMALPSLKVIAAPEITIDGFKRKKPLPPSHVTDIAFMRQDISARAFKSLLQGGAALKTCHLTVGSTKHFSVPDFVKVLFENASHSLENLILEVPLECCRSTSNNLPPAGGLELRGFSRLKNVSITFDSLGITSPKIKLGDLLPPSLEKLELMGPAHYGNIYESTCELLDTKPPTHQNLSVLSLRGDVPPNEDLIYLQEACKCRGIAPCGELKRMPHQANIRHNLYPAIWPTFRPSFGPLGVDHSFRIDPRRFVGEDLPG